MAADRTFNVLFLCTGNAARSIMAEAILNSLGKGHFHAYSAGSFPKGEVHRLALKVIATMGMQADGFRSKSWEEFSKPGAPAIDFVFTVCDNAAGEVCPVWPGQPMTAHWGIEDPAAKEGTLLEQEAAFVEAARFLRNRIAAFVSLPMKSLEAVTLRAELTKIGRQPGASPKAG
jgi:arsenate reductase